MLLLFVRISGYSQIIDLGNSTDSISAEGCKAFLNEIGDARIVILGEQHHGTGSDYKVFSTLVKCLHEEKGFHVIANEFSIFTFYESLDSITRSGASSQIYRPFMYWPQGLSNEYDALFNYMDEQSKRGNPLHMEGFDPRMRSSETKGFIPFYTQLLMQHGIPIDTTSGYYRTLVGVITKEYNDSASTADAQAFIQQTQEIKQKLMTGQCSRRHLLFVDNLLAYAQNAWNLEGYKVTDPKRFLHREKQMAQNIIWLAEVAYPNQKIIVRTHNGHAAKNFNTLHGILPDSMVNGIVSVGELLDRHFGPSLKIIGSTSYEGTYCGWDFKPKTIPVPNPLSLESELACKQYNFAYVDLQNHSPDSFYMFFSDYNTWAPGEEIRAPFQYIFDGMIFTRTAMPATRKDDE